MDIDKFKKSSGISQQLADRWYDSIKCAIDEFNITNVAMFIAQVGHESSSFTRIVESLNYTPAGLVATFGNRITQYQAEMLGRTNAHPANQSAIANIVYANRMGNAQAGDGWKYRGRGLIQITGLENYRRCGNALRLDLVKNPELLELDINASRSAAWYFVTYGCDRCGSDVERVTKIINGGKNGIDDRCLRYEIARTALS